MFQDSSQLCFDVFFVHSSAFNCKESSTSPLPRGNHVNRCEGPGVNLIPGMYVFPCSYINPPACIRDLAYIPTQCLTVMYGTYVTSNKCGIPG